jgi:hypothetical protein
MYRQVMVFPLRIPATEGFSEIVSTKTRSSVAGDVPIILPALYERHSNSDKRLFLKVYNSYNNRDFGRSALEIF